MAGISAVYLGFVIGEIFNAEMKLQPLREKDLALADKMEYFTNLISDAKNMQPGQVQEVQIAELSQDGTDIEYSTKRFVMPSADKIRDAYKNKAITNGLDPAQIGRSNALKKSLELYGIRDYAKPYYIDGEKIQVKTYQAKVTDKAEARALADKLAKDVPDMPDNPILREELKKKISDKIYSSIWDEAGNKPKQFTTSGLSKDVREETGKVLTAGAKEKYKEKGADGKEVEKEKDMAVKNEGSTKQLYEKVVEGATVPVTLDSQLPKEEKGVTEEVRDYKSMTNQEKAAAVRENDTEFKIATMPIGDGKMFIGDASRPTEDGIVGAAPIEKVEEYPEYDPATGKTEIKKIVHWKKIAPGQDLHPVAGFVYMGAQQMKHYAEFMKQLIVRVQRKIKTQITILEMKLNSLRAWERTLQQGVAADTRSTFTNPFGQGQA